MDGSRGETRGTVTHTTTPARRHPGPAARTHDERTTNVPTHGRRLRRVAVPLAVTAAAGAAVLVPSFLSASSHREAPSISQDPTADNTDVYAFRSPDAPNTATLIANFVPFQEPAGGPNFYRFSDDVKYEIKVDNTGDGRSDVTYEFRFDTTIKNPATFLYNGNTVTYDAKKGEYVNLNLVQTYTLRKITRDSKGRTVVSTLGRNLLTPPNNVGPRSTPDYESLVTPAIHSFKNGTKVFAGQRDDPFYVDLGGTFDLLGFRSAPPGAFSTGGVDGLRGYSVNTIAIQVPIKHLTRTKSVPTDINATSSAVGVYATASRPVVDVRKGDSRVRWQQVSRLGQPLVNEVLIPLGKKDLWNRSEPSDDSQFERNYLKPELAGIINALYDIGAPTTGRVDLTTVLLTGIPPKNGLGLPTTQISGGKPAKADLLRVNLAVPPTPFAQQDRLGLLAGQADGFPNGRRLVDDVVDIEERAVAGVLAPAFGLPAPNGGNAALAPLLGDGVNANDTPFLESFPYVATPGSGFDSVPHP